MNTLWFWLPALAVAFAVREWIKSILRPNVCPGCGHRRVRLISRWRFAAIGIGLLFWASASQGWYWLLVLPGLAAFAFSPADEARLWCPTCRQGGPVLSR